MDEYTQKRARRKLVVLAAILLAVTMAFTGMLNYLAFTDNYRQSQVQSFAVAGKGTVSKIEAALRYGKPLENFYGMTEILLEIKRVIPGVDEVNIIASDGQILYSTGSLAEARKISDELLQTANFAQGAIRADCSYKFIREYCHIYLRISDSVSPHLASLEMVLPAGDFSGLVGTYLTRLIAYVSIIVIAALGCLLFIIFRTRLMALKDGAIPQKRVLALLLLILGCSQLVYSGLNYALFQEAYLHTAGKSAAYIEQVVTDNLADISEKGLTLNEISGLEEYLVETAAGIPEIEKIEVVSGTQCVRVLISSAHLDKKMFDIFLDMLTVLVISIFFMIELTLLATLLLGGRPATPKEESVEIAPNTSGLIRGLIFLANIGLFMSISFVPLVMNKLYQPIAGLPPDIVLGLPISAEMLAGVAAIILAGRLIAQKGWKPIFYLGVLLLTAGCFLSGTSSGALSFIFARSVAGCGAGFMMMALRSLVVMLPEQSAAIAEFSAGAVAGLNCGAVIGGMLAERIGYAGVFYLSALIVLLSAFFARKNIANYRAEQTDSAPAAAWDNFLRFITDKNALLFLLLIFLPLLAAGVFLNYAFPLLAQAHNLSQGNISRVFLLNGICIIYLGPVLTKLTTRYLESREALLLSSLVVIAGMLLFMHYGTIAAALALVVLLGISDSFGTAAQTGYFLNLRPVRQLGLSKGIGYFSIIVNIGKMLGPVIFGLAFTWGVQKGVGVLAVFFAVMLALFLLMDKK
ncbi:MAG: MFS transporter [Clostridia bacterium]|nr:MFS transporter [Clostridia bacterium]